MSVTSSYVICTSPRSGSTLLCRLLDATGIAGKPASYFHAQSRLAWLKSLDLPVNPEDTERDQLKAVIHATIDRGRADGDVFGLRLQRPSFGYLMAQLGLLFPHASRGVDRLQAAFGPTRLVYLHRQNKVAQAVSLLKAQQTGLWHQAADGTELERLAPPSQPAYDVEAIRERHQQATALDAEWEGWFTDEGLTPLRISYEGLSDAPSTTLARVLHALDLDPQAAQGVLPDTRKLGDATSAAWERRFRRETDLVDGCGP